MPPRRPVVLASAAAVAVAAAGVTTWVVTRPEPLPAMATTTLGPSGTADLAVEVAAPGGCPAFTFRAPAGAQPKAGGAGIVNVALSPESDGLDTFGVWCGTLPDGESFDSYVDGMRRTDSRFTDAVVERSALGDAVRMDVDWSHQDMTSWLVERDGHLVKVECWRADGDEQHLPTAEQMVASWVWT